MTPANAYRLARIIERGRAYDVAKASNPNFTPKQVRRRANEDPLAMVCLAELLMETK